MIDRNKRGVRSVGGKARLAVAAAVLVGGAAAGVVALDAGHNNVTTVRSASYTASSRPTISEAAALTLASDDWAKSPAKSLAALAQMTPIRAFREQREHGITFAAQRGIVVRVTKKLLVVKSANGEVHLWRLSGTTRFKDVADTNTGMAALTGSKATARATRATKDVMRGDLVLVAGTSAHGLLKAELVLFATPRTSMPRPTAKPTVIPSPNVTISGQPAEIGSHS
jgi:hypothetical protein